MGGLNTSDYNIQVVGKIGYINRLLRKIESTDAEFYSIIVKEYQKEISALKDYPKFEELLKVIDRLELPDLKALENKSFVLQELNRLVDLLKPHNMDANTLESVYHDMKAQPDLWKSFYHRRLNDIEKLSNAIEHATAPKQWFLRFYLTTLQQHVMTNGLRSSDETLNTILKSALTTLELPNQTIERQFQIFSAFVTTMEKSSLLKVEELNESGLVQELRNHLAPKLSSRTLQKKLSDYASNGIVDSEFVHAIDQLLAVDKQLQRLKQLTMGEHRLKEETIESVFSSAVENLSLTEALDRARAECEILLLNKTYPDAKSIFKKIAANAKEASWASIPRSPEFLASIVEHTLLINVCKGATNRQEKAIAQLCQELRHSLEQNTGLSIESDVTDIQHCLEDHVETLGNTIDERTEKLFTMGYDSKTFEAIDAIIEGHFGGDFDLQEVQEDDPLTVATQRFFKAIMASKAKHFYVTEYSIKSPEQISIEDFKGFFAECCTAGENAAQELADNRPFVKKIADTLKAIANWVIRLFSTGQRPQFFKPETTPVSEISQAIQSLRTTLAETLDHLDLQEKPSPSLSSSR